MKFGPDGWPSRAGLDNIPPSVVVNPLNAIARTPSAGHRDGPYSCSTVPRVRRKVTYDYERPKLVRPRGPPSRLQAPPDLVLVNGLAEQSESWFANRAVLSRHFDVQGPRDPGLRRRRAPPQIEAGGEVTVDYLADRLCRFLDEFVQRPPYHLVGSSLGGQVTLTVAVRHPEKRLEAGADLPFGLPRRREPADDRRGQAEPVRHPGPIGLLPQVRLRQTSWSPRCTGSSRTGGGRRGCSGPCGDGRPLGRRRCCRRSRTRRW